MISNDPLHSTARWLTAPHTLPRRTQRRLFSFSVSSGRTHTHTHTQTHRHTCTNSDGAVGAQLGGLSCNWIGLYLGSVVKVKRLEAFSNGLKTGETLENKKGHYQLVLWGKRMCVCLCLTLARSRDKEGDAE